MAALAPGLTSAPQVSAQRRRPRALLAVSWLVALLLLLPLAFLLLEAHQVGWSQLSSLLFRQLTASLLWNMVRLAVVVTALAAVIGTAAAWCVERTDLPGRRVVALLLVLPLAAMVLPNASKSCVAVAVPELFVSARADPKPSKAGYSPLRRSRSFPMVYAAVKLDPFISVTGAPPGSR